MPPPDRMGVGTHRQNAAPPPQPDPAGPQTRARVGRRCGRVGGRQPAPDGRLQRGDRRAPRCQRRLDRPPHGHPQPAGGHARRSGWRPMPRTRLRWPWRARASTRATSTSCWSQRRRPTSCCPTRRRWSLTRWALHARVRSTSAPPAPASCRRWPWARRRSSPGARRACSRSARTSCRGSPIPMTARRPPCSPTAPARSCWSRRTGQGRIGPVVLGSDGGGADNIFVERAEARIRMRGHETFREAVTRLSDSTLAAARVFRRRRLRGCLSRSIRSSCLRLLSPGQRPDPELRGRSRRSGWDYGAARTGR